MKADNRYIAYLDGLRGYAILFVILGHFYLGTLNLSKFGVTVFFFVSGFLITKLLIHETEKKGKINLRDFYLRRVFRLYPALLLMLGVTIAVLVAWSFTINWTDILAGVFYFTNYYQAYVHPPSPPNYLMVSSILWSLAVEEHFYLIFPLLFAAFYGKGRWFLKGLAFSLLGFFLVRLIEAGINPRYYWSVYYTTHTRGDSIVWGCVSALLLYQVNAAWYIRILRSAWIWIIACLVLVACVAIRGFFFDSIFAFTLQGAALFVLIPKFSFMDTDAPVSRLVNNRVIIWVGRLSYSLYLFHWVALKIAYLCFPARSLNWYLLGFSLTIVLACISFYLVEQPFLKIRKRFGSSAATAPRPA